MSGSIVSCLAASQQLAKCVVVQLETCAVCGGKLTWICWGFAEGHSHQ